MKRLYSICYYKNGRKNTDDREISPITNKEKAIKEAKKMFKEDKGVMMVNVWKMEIVGGYPSHGEIIYKEVR